MVAELVIELNLPYLHHQGKFSSIALARPPGASTGRRQGQLPCLLSEPWGQLMHTQPSECRQGAGPNFPCATVCEGLEWFSCFITLRAGSPVLPLSSALCCSGKVHGLLLSLVQYLLRGRDSSPALMTPWQLSRLRESAHPPIHIIRASSSIFLLPGPAPLHCLGDLQGLVSRVLLQMMGAVSFPNHPSQ